MENFSFKLPFRFLDYYPLLQLFIDSSAAQSVKKTDFRDHILIEMEFAGSEDKEAFIKKMQENGLGLSMSAGF